LKPDTKNSELNLKRKERQAGTPLFISAGKLKRVKRTGWLRKVGITKDCESVADHSFRTAILGIYFGLELGMDSPKIVRMCLIHDLAESEIGDKMPEEKISEIHHRINEDLVVAQILDNLPEKSRKVLQDDWKELLEAKSDEAILVWQLDKLEMLLQSIDYGKMGYEKLELKQFQNIELREKLLSIAARLYPLTI
jgi:putative hydrolases of HD superfamily